MRKRMRAVIAVALSLIMIGIMFLVGCNPIRENVDGPGNETVDKPDDGNGDEPDNDDEPEFDPFSAEIYGEYLSDMDWEPNSQAGWVVKDVLPQGHLFKDKFTDIKSNTDYELTLKIGNTARSFEKGLFTHAEANVYYNIENCNYQYLTAYVGFQNGSPTNTNGAKFFVFTSNDDILDENTTWTLKSAPEPTLMTRGQEAEFLSVNVGGAKWLRLYVDPNGTSSNAGSGDFAVWADAKLTNSSSGNELLDCYDEKIKAKEGKNVDSDAKLERLVLQRQLVGKVGQDVFNKFVNESEDNKKVMEWLFNDLDALQEFIIGGAPGYGNYYNSLTVLSDLYRNYKEDLNNTQLLNNKWKPERTYGDMYRTMMFSIALTHDISVGSWMQKKQSGEPIRSVETVCDLQISAQNRAVYRNAKRGRNARL